MTSPPLADALGWKCWDHAVRRLGPDTFLVTYVLPQGDRLTCRASIWEHTQQGRRVLFHQGTVVATEEDDAVPE